MATDNGLLSAAFTVVCVGSGAAAAGATAVSTSASDNNSEKGHLEQRAWAR